MISVKSLCDSIKKIAEKTGRTAAAQIPAIVMLCSMAKRPGLSSIISTINWVQNLKKQGITTDPLPSGEPNLWVVAQSLGFQEIYRALKEDANIQGAGAPSAITITGTGANSGGPVQITGFNVNPFKLVGIIQ